MVSSVTFVQSVPAGCKGQRDAKGSTGKELTLYRGFEYVQSRVTDS